ncbi:MAG: tRNA (adenosine(37)-N6)-threonylcarbamoyltransferase complex ATPase subunit type 1 TsaE [Myxococcaceae bacterium]|nr:tRNA (adenosine(37)-N6)-threonylcarbamoyltransferase complex ATPase subunit type 1 TsaE [Myxococcaceae bacterium]
METMKDLRLTSQSVDQTRAIGGLLGALLQPGDFIGLQGDLGAGKTQFVKGLARGLAIAEEDVSSPTFAILQSYSGRLTLHHADFYRLVTDDELYATGFFDLQTGSSVSVVEWADKFPRALPDDWLRVSIVSPEPHRRELLLSAIGLKAGERIAALQQALFAMGTAPFSLSP